MKLEGPPPGPPFVPTIPNLLAWVRERQPDNLFLTLEAERLTYADVDRRSAELAKGLLAIGVGKASRVGIMMPNTPDWVIAWLACGRIGALAVTLSTFYQAPEIAWGVRHNDVQVLLTVDRYLKADYLERMERGLPGLAESASTELYLPTAPYLRRIVVWGGCDRPWAMKGPDDLLAAAAARPGLDDALLARAEAAVTPSDALVTICTSGTTAEPKAVVHSHGSALRAPWQFLDYYDVQSFDRTYPGMPFFWIGGLNTHLLPAMYTGSALCCTRTPEPQDIIETAAREKITIMLQWPTQMRRMEQVMKATGQTLPSVRLGIGPSKDLHGNVIPPERMNGQSLGMTESFGMHGMTRLDTPANLGKAGANGRTLTGMERVIVDTETGAVLPRGQQGEIFLRGNHMMIGYYGKERWQTFTRDGFFPTGDLAVMDEEDYVWFQGRAGEMIKTAGANVAPPEVEAALATLEGVREAIVFGVPDEAKGEAVVAVVSPTHGAELDAATLHGSLREMISPYKLPQSIAFLSFDEIPRTAAGKPIKTKLREMLFPADS
jgi:acyl-CoA synthetase (AMP-forming)/AMP-acid ligase II